MQPSFAQSLQTFAQPSIPDLRQDLVRGWSESFPTPELGAAIIANDRFRDRVIAQICMDAGGALQPVDLGAEEEAGVAVLMTLGREAFSLRIGCALYRATVIEWITWNSFGQQLPQVPFAEASRLVANVPSKLSLMAGGPDASRPEITPVEIEAKGSECLDAWIAGLHPDVLRRLALFTKVETGSVNPRKAALVSLVATLLTSEKEQIQ